jgi:hypothetical protein
LTFGFPESGTRAMTNGLQPFLIKPWDDRDFNIKNAFWV